MTLSLLLLTQVSTLWQIGIPDGKPDGFALAPGGYSQYKDDALFLVGKSLIRDWPYVLPGPNDIWAGSKTHRNEIVFGLSGVKKSGKYKLKIDLADTHYNSPPQLALIINGKKVATWQSPKGKDDRVILGQASTGTSSQWITNIDATSFQNGNNTVSILSEKGSWLVFDSLSLQGPTEVRSTPIQDQVTLNILPSKQAILRTPNGNRQPIECEILNFGSARTATFQGRDSKKTIDLQPGRQTVELEVEPLKKPQTIQLVLTSGSLKATATQQVQPVRPWVVHLFPHSHIDIGYTDLQDRVLQMHQRNFTDAIAVARENQNNPSDSKFRFNVEATWVFDRLMQTGTEAQKAEVVRALKDRTLFLSAGYANLLTGVMHPEEMMQSFRYAHTLGEQFGLKFDTATQTDVPGVSWGYLTALQEAGIKNLVLMPNAGDRVGGTLKAWGDRPFWWTGPSGNERVLVWQTDPYSVGVSAGWNGDRSQPLRSDDPSSRFIGPYLFNKLQRLSNENYPYDIIAEPWSVQDNAPVDADVPIAAKAWNEKYVYPRIIISTVDQACHDLREKYASKLPIIQGDYTPYWEDGVGSTAAHTAMNRTTPNVLIQLETLYAMNPIEPYPKEEFLEAWRNSILFSEHTWGAWNSVSAPDDETVKAEWEIKSGFATTAQEIAIKLLSSLTAAESKTIEIRNTNSWPRTDLVTIPRYKSQAGDRVEDVKGKPLPSQRLQNGDLAILVRDVPPLGSIRLKIFPGKAHVESQITATTTTLKNEFYTINLDPKTGAIASLRADKLNRELAQKPINNYLYLPGTDLKNLRTNPQPRIQLLESGPLVATISAASIAPGTKSLEQQITLVAGLDRIDINNTLDKLAIREKEGVHFAFPFDIPSGKMRIDLSWSVIEPEKHQIAGSNKNWLTTQNFVDISNQNYGITWTSLDAPLIEIGEISGNLLGSVSNPNDWRQKIEPTQTFFSWALNNHWHTNYKAEQEGPLTFRYALQAHQKYQPHEARKFGTERREPLIVGPETQSPQSLFTISDPTVIATRIAPTDDGKAIIVRLFGTADKPKKVTLTLRPDLGAISQSDISQRPIKPLSTTIQVPAQGVLTLRIERKTTSTQ